MSNIKEIYFSLHLLLSVMLLSLYLISIMIHKDELEEKAQNYALKISNIVTVIVTIGYVLYKAVIGNIEIDIKSVLVVINILCVVYLIADYLYKKGFVISYKVKNKKILNAICNLCTILGIGLIITSVLKVKFLDIKSGIIRLDTLLIMINMIIVSIIIGLYPREKVSREEYREREVFANKFTLIFGSIYGVCFLAFLGYIVYRFVI